MSETDGKRTGEGKTNQQSADWKKTLRNRPSHPSKKGRVSRGVKLRPEFVPLKIRRILPTLSSASSGNLVIEILVFCSNNVAQFLQVRRNTSDESLMLQLFVKVARIHHVPSPRLIVVLTFLTGRLIITTLVYVCAVSPPPRQGRKF